MKKERKKERKKGKKSGFFSNFVFKLLVILGLLTLFFIFYKLSQQVYRQKEINQEIINLQNEIDRLNQDNNRLRELGEYFQTDRYKEKEAREKLGLIKEGEELIEIKEKEVPMQEEMEEQKPRVEINQPNYYYWWHYFFSLE